MHFCFWVLDPRFRGDERVRRTQTAPQLRRVGIPLPLIPMHFLKASRITPLIPAQFLEASRITPLIPTQAGIQRRCSCAFIFAPRIPAIAGMSG